MAALQPDPANLLSEDRTPMPPLTSSKDGNTNYPPEFTGSTEVVTTEQTGIPVGDTLPVNNPPSGLVASELQQTSQQERKLVQTNASFTGLTLPQQVTDPIYGVSAIVEKSIQPTFGGVNSTTVTAGGSAYTAATVVTAQAPADGLPAQFSPMIVGGVITAINIIDPGSGYHSAPVLTIADTGGGSGATATCTIPVIPINGSGIESITVGAGGSSYTSAATATVPAPTSGNAAVLSVVVSGGAIMAINVVSRGTGYTSAPTVTIHANGTGTGASAAAVLGWVTFYDRIPLQKWQSIQIASKIDLDTLPSTLTIPKMQRLALPDVLAAISGQWSVEAGVSQNRSTAPPGLGGTAHCTEDGGVNIQIRSGFRGYAKGALIRKFFSALPQQSDLPTPTLIIPSMGTCVTTANGNSISVQYTTFSSASAYSGMIRAHSVSIGPVLTNAVTPTNTSDSHSQNASDSTSGGGLVASYNITANSSGTLTVSLPFSTPIAFSPGDTIILDGEVSQWRFGIYVLEYNEAFHP